MGEAYGIPAAEKDYVNEAFKKKTRKGEGGKPIR